MDLNRLTSALIFALVFVNSAHAESLAAPQISWLSSDGATSAVTGKPVTFSVSASDIDPLHSYSWDFGDGSTSEGQSVQHEFSAPGVYVVKLTLSNGIGSAETERIVAVNESGTQKKFQLYVYNATVMFDFKRLNRDRLSLKGSVSDSSDSIPSITFVFGNHMETIVVNRNWNGSNDNSRFQLSWVGFSFRTKNKSLFDSLKEYGFTQDQQTETFLYVPAILSLDGLSNVAIIKLRYKTRLMVSGKAKAIGIKPSDLR